MAGTITELVNGIRDSIDGLVADLKGQNSGAPTYHYGDAEYKFVQSQLNQSNWMKLSFPYTFAVVNLKNPSDNGGFSDFALPLAPQQINQKEPPAINIKPTQGGTTVNHNGMGYKELSISGTTGIAPFRGQGGVDRKTGEAIFQPKDLKHKSGYEVFIHLRNWFRTYYEFKKKRGKEARNYRLIWKNFKDGEFLIVELLTFEMDRNSSRPFLYDYKLEFKVLANFKFSTPDTEDSPLAKLDNALQTALDKVNLARGVFLRTQGILREVEDTFESTVLEPLRVASLAIKAAIGVPLVAADMGRKALTSTVSTASALAAVTSEATRFAQLATQGNSSALAEAKSLVDKSQGTIKNALAQATRNINQSGAAGLSSLGGLLMQMDSGLFPEKTIDAVNEEQTNASTTPRSFYQNSIADFERIKQNSEDKFNLGSTFYDNLFHRTQTVTADPLTVVTDDQYAILNGFNNAIIGLYMTMTAVDLFKSDFESRIQDLNTRFNNEIQLIGNQSVRQIRYDAGLTLEKIAQRELGDSTRWGEIAEVNNLKPPYVSDNKDESRVGVVGAGQPLLIPQSIVNGFSKAPPTIVNKLTVSMNELQRSLGTDLKVTKDFDLALTNSGDFDIIAGGDNMSQSVILKFFYSPGEVIRHPQIGAGLLPGKKFPDLNDVKDGIINSLLQDQRVQSVDNLALQRKSSALYITFLLRIKQVDLPIPVKIRLPS